MIGNAAVMVVSHVEDRPVAKVSFWEDLKRRNVYRVGVAYAALAWFTIEVCETVFPLLGLSSAAVTVVLVLALIGFPVALVCGWVFQITPEGLVIDKPHDVRWSTYLLVDSLIVITLLAAASIYWFRIHQVGPFDNSIAVLRFENLGSDPGADYLGDGLTEDLINELTNLKSLKVAARTSVWAISGSGLDVPQIAKRLKVSKLIEGSVRLQRDRVRVTAQLVDDEGNHLWSRAYDRMVDDVLDIQKDIAKQVVNELKLVLATESRTRLEVQVTSSPRAYDRYLRGRQFLRRPAEAENLSRAILAFDDAIELDPRFSLPYAGLCEAELALYRLSRDTGHFEAAELACHRALTLDAGLAEVYTALGNLYRHAGLADKAQNEYLMALAINDGLEEANYGLGRSYQAQGRLEAAEEALLRSVELEPGYFGSYLGYGNFLHRLGRYADAVPYYLKVTELAPDYAGGFINLGSALHWLGDWDGAEVAWRRSLELNPSSMAYQNLGTLHYYERQFGEAVDMHKKATEVSPSDHRAWGRLADTQRFEPGQEAESILSYNKAVGLAESQLAVNPDDPEDLAYLAQYKANLGDLEPARILASRAAAAAGENPNTHYAVAIVAMNSQQPVAAVAALRRAVEEGYSIRLLQADPELDSLRDRTDFKALIAISASARSQ